jgi:hypothetical protein
VNRELRGIVREREREREREDEHKRSKVVHEWYILAFDF